jgi:AcrR family transcriptional regulator
MAQNVKPGLRERKRIETRRRLADAAVRLVSEHGIAATTVDEIVEAAGVGRATFFRYFESKELAIATGLSEVAVYVLISVLSDLPPELGPLEAVRESHAAIGRVFEPNYDELYEQALLSVSTPAMQAWTLRLYVEWEIAIAELIAPRFDDLVPNDPRPRMIGAINMAAVRLARDEWVAAGGQGDLLGLVQKYLSAIELPSLIHATV